MDRPEVDWVTELLKANVKAMQETLAVQHAANQVLEVSTLFRVGGRGRDVVFPGGWIGAWGTVWW